MGGMMVTFSYCGTQVGAGFSPATYAGPAGNPSTVCAESFQNLVFSHWDGGLTDPCRTFGLDQNTALTAAYDT
jgi:hypothetical protein